MDFRITPFLFALAHNLLMLWANPTWNNSTALRTLAEWPRWGGIYVVLYALSLGAYFRHSYYSKMQQALYWFLQVSSIGLAIAYVLALQAQHLS
jgi:hypothetical protein